VIDARELITTHGPDLVRYLLLSTHYRSPIDFGEEVLAACKKGISTFYRLFDRVERLTGQPLADKGVDMDVASRELLDVAAVAEFVRGVLSFKLKFLEMMDDDFNTAGRSRCCTSWRAANGFMEQSGVEKNKDPQMTGAVTAAAQTLKSLGQVLGLFRVRREPAKEDSALTEGLMKLLIALRNEARKTKNFALADAVRKGLAELGVTLEDRAMGRWRKD